MALQSSAADVIALESGGATESWSEGGPFALEVRVAFDIGRRAMMARRDRQLNKSKVAESVPRDYQVLGRRVRCPMRPARISGDASVDGETN